MDRELTYAVEATEAEAQYDEQAKRLLGHKDILSRILVKTVDEFKGMDPREVETYIEGEPLIGKVPVEPGLTNLRPAKSGELVRGFNTEMSEVHEGMVRFDIVFYVRMQDGLSQIIINIELQKSEPDEYDILNRAIFYVSRLISSQKGRDFSKSRYNDLRKVYNIWICMDMDACILNHIHLTDEKLMGNHEWKGRLDLFNIIMIGLPKKLPKQEPQYELHRLLTALLSMELTADEKMNIMSNEYDIATDSSVGKEAQYMCNLSQSVLERGLEQGREQAYKELILKMHGRGDSIEAISELVEISTETIEAIIKEAYREDLT